MSTISTKCCPCNPSTTTSGIIEIIDNVGLQGAKGDSGLTPYINSNTGTWFIGTTDTGVRAQGLNGSSVHIDESTLHWIIDNPDGTSTDTGIIAGSKSGEAPVSNVKTFDTRDDFPTAGENDVLYVDNSTNYIYRWLDNNYVYISVTDTNGKVSDEFLKYKIKEVIANVLITETTKPAYTGNKDSFTIYEKTIEKLFDQNTGDEISVPEENTLYIVVTTRYHLDPKGDYIIIDESSSNSGDKSVNSDNQNYSVNGQIYRWSPEYNIYKEVSRVNPLGTNIGDSFPGELGNKLYTEFKDISYKIENIDETMEDWANNYFLDKTKPGYKLIKDAVDEAVVDVSVSTIGKAFADNDKNLQNVVSDSSIKEKSGSYSGISLSKINTDDLSELDEIVLTAN